MSFLLSPLLSDSLSFFAHAGWFKYDHDWSYHEAANCLSFSMPISTGWSTTLWLGLCKLLLLPLGWGNAEFIYSKLNPPWAIVMGGFHFFIIFFFLAIVIYVIFHLELWCFPYCCKSTTKTFQSKKEAFDQQVWIFHFRNKERY